MVKQGYKKTEIGVIPEDWIIFPANKLMKIETGSKNTEDKKEDGKFPFFVRSSKIENIDTYSYDCEAVLTAGDGVGTGKVFHYYNGKFDVHQRVYVMYEFDDIIGKYFYYYFSENFRDEVAKYTAKSSVDSVRKNMIADMLIPVMSNSEQREITKALSDVDSLIDSLEKLIGKKKNIKQGVMQELLTGKKRLPGFTGEWQVTTMRRYLGLQVGFPFASEYFNTDHNGYRLIKNRDLKSDDLVFYTTEPYNKEFIVNNGDILVGMDGDFLPCKWNKGEALLNQRVGRLYTKENISLNFCYYSLEKPLYELQNGTGATTVKHLSHKDIEKLVINMPMDIEEQEAIASVFSDMDDELEALEQKLEKYRMLKQGMMQQLLTGKIRLV